VRAIITGGPDGIRALEAHGVRFERSVQQPEEYDLGREGGHSFRRVLHAGDITGHEIIRQLLRTAMEHPRITVLENAMAIDLVTTGWLRKPGENTCIGAYFLDAARGEIFAVRARHTVLATGGACKVYLYTSNPDVATGDGVAMAWRAGLPVKNMEMVQFHPTCLFHPKAKSFLISEAVRGEGGVLVDAEGTPLRRGLRPPRLARAARHRRPRHRP
jgi:L-aspartate oxidase